MNVRIIDVAMMVLFKVWCIEENNIILFELVKVLTKDVSMTEVYRACYYQLTSDFFAN